MSRASREWKAVIRSGNADRSDRFIYSYDSEGVAHFVDVKEAPPIVPKKQQSLRAYRAWCRHLDREFRDKRRATLDSASLSHLSAKNCYRNYHRAISCCYCMPRHLFLRRYVLKQKEE